MRWTALRTIACLTLAVAACARTDVGAPCHLQTPNGAELNPQPGREYIYLGSGECESFACIATPGATSGYCSQSCAGTGASCPSGLTCTLMALSPDYLDTMRARLTPDRYQQLFGQLGSSWYCVKPR